MRRKINWVEIMNDYQINDDLSTIDFCNIKGISPSALYKHLKEGKTSDFVDISNLSVNDNNISIILNGFNLKFSRTLDIDDLKKIFQAMQND